MICSPIPTAVSDWGFPSLSNCRPTCRKRFPGRCPADRGTAGTPINRLVPIIEHNGEHFVVLFNLITNLSSRLLRHPVGSIAQYRDDLSRALYWLFFGI
jgi:hypothetical protein